MADAFTRRSVSRQALRPEAVPSRGGSRDAGLRPKWVEIRGRVGLAAISPVLAVSAFLSERISQSLFFFIKDMVTHLRRDARELEGRAGSGKAEKNPQRNSG